MYTEQNARKEEDAHAGLFASIIAKSVLILLDSPQSPFSRETPVILECYLLRLIPFIISATVLKACIVFSQNRIRQTSKLCNASFHWIAIPRSILSTKSARVGSAHFTSGVSL